MEISQNIECDTFVLYQATSWMPTHWYYTLHFLYKTRKLNIQRTKYHSMMYAHNRKLDITKNHNKVSVQGSNDKRPSDLMKCYRQNLSRPRGLT